MDWKFSPTKVKIVLKPSNLSIFQPHFYASEKPISALKYSASKAIFTETNQLVEKIVDWFYFVSIKLTVVGAYVPLTIYTYFIYFTTDLGNAAFELPMPLW